MKRGMPAWKMLQCDGNMMTRKRSLHTVVTFCNSMFVFGGAVDNSNVVDIYNTDECRWHCISYAGEAPPCLWGHSAIQHHTYMFVFGGADKSGGLSNTIHCLDFSAGCWSVVEPATSDVPQPRLGHTATLLVNKEGMLIFGGETRAGQLPTNDLWLFHFPSRQWHPIRAGGIPPRGRKHHSATEWDGHLYFFGGTDSRATFNDMYVLDLDGSGWQTVEGGDFVPTERFGHTSVVHNGRMHVFGGMENAIISGGLEPSAARAHNLYLLNDWYKFSFKFGTWIRLQPQGHTPSSRWGHTACQFNGKLFIFGGQNQRGSLNDMFEISLSTLTDDIFRDVAGTKLVSSVPCEFQPSEERGRGEKRSATDGMETDNPCAVIERPGKKQV
eukprot:TRINITY_DN19094_c0_g1_i4.p1 TRINITY_DN19094_c0_g1~~TRINITY_DN19094_c0_g1_i4.p1  ORF type:complete len:402 (+),score=39.18 TRINITY_DN19094_c0_g1_i4:56-1207(+)